MYKKSVDRPKIYEKQKKIFLTIFYGAKVVQNNHMKSWSKGVQLIKNDPL